MRAQPQKKHSISKFCLHILGILLCVTPPAICTLCYFPLWKNDGERTLVGAVAFLLILSAIPLFKLLKKKLETAASYVLWLILFLLFFFLARIADEMTVISFYGFLGNLLGAFCMKLAERGKDRES
jgi:phosphatidylserine synthase